MTKAATAENLTQEVTAKQIMINGANLNPAEIFYVSIVNGQANFGFKLDSPSTAALIKWIFNREIDQAIANMAVRKPEEK